MATPPRLRRRDGLALAAASWVACAAQPLRAVAAAAAAAAAAADDPASPPGTLSPPSQVCQGDEALCRLLAPAGTDRSNTHGSVIEIY